MTCTSPTYQLIAFRRLQRRRDRGVLIRTARDERLLDDFGEP